MYQKILSYLGASPGSFPSPPPTLISGISTNGTGTAGLSPALVEVVLKIDARLIVSLFYLLSEGRTNDLGYGVTENDLAVD